MSEQNKSLVRRFVDEIWNKKNLNKLEEFLSPQYSAHTPDGTIHGLKEFRQFHQGYQEAFPDCRIAVGEMLAEGNLVSCRITFSGTHKGELKGVPATGKQIKEECIMQLRVSGGKIAEDISIWDRLSLYQQLGVAPEGMSQAAKRAGR
jgi:steroid delta-isomerase-like uncharacterized protein